MKEKISARLLSLALCAGALSGCGAGEEASSEPAANDGVQDPRAVMEQVRKNCKKVEDDCEIFL